MSFYQLKIHENQDPWWPPHYGIHTLSLATLLWKPGHQMNYPYHPLPMIPTFIEKCPLVLKPRKSFQYTHWKSHEEHCMSIHFGPLWKDLFKSFKSSLYLVLQKTMTKQPVLQPVGNSFPPQVWYIWCSYDSIRYSIRLILSILEILSASRARTL